MAIKFSALIFLLIATLVMGGAGCSSSTPEKQGYKGTVYVPPSSLVINSRVRSHVKFAETQKMPEIDMTQSLPLKQEKVDEGAIKIKQEKLQEQLEPYKSDAEYLSINRYEWPHIMGPKKVKAALQLKLGSAIRKTVRTIDKPLVFSGKGFEIEGFSNRSQEKLYFDFNRHLEKPLPWASEKKTSERLALKEEHTQSTRVMVFHPTRSALGKLPELEEYRSLESLEEGPAVHLKKVPETELILEHGMESHLILKLGRHSLDLLRDNKKIILDTYKN